MFHLIAREDLFYKYLSFLLKETIIRGMLHFIQVKFVYFYLSDIFLIRKILLFLFLCLATALNYGSRLSSYYCSL